MNYYRGDNLKPNENPKTIALCLVATSSYTSLLRDLIESAKKHFLANHRVSLFIFSDRDCYDSRGSRWLDTFDYEVFWTKIEHNSWPLPTLLRYSYLLKQKHKLSEFDYIFYCDADSRFFQNIGDEVLGSGLTVVQHFMAAGKQTKSTESHLATLYSSNSDCRNSNINWDIENKFKNLVFEANQNSTASLPRKTDRYFIGSFHGGSSEAYIDAITSMSYNINKDLSNNIIAEYHDESHLNKYLCKNPPARVMPFWYYVPAGGVPPECVPIPSNEQMKIGFVRTVEMNIRPATKMERNEL